MTGRRKVKVLVHLGALCRLIIVMARPRFMTRVISRGQGMVRRAIRHGILERCRLRQRRKARALVLAN
jgi:hypothetical protein